MKQLLLDIKLPVTVSLDNFVPGRNHELLQLLKKMQFAQEKERPVYIWGKPGSGKSHLLQAMVGFFLQQNFDAYYCPGDIYQEIDVSDRFACLAVDDVERLNDVAQIKLFNLYNEFRDDHRVSLLVSGSVPPSQLALRQDLVTRLGWDGVYQVYELSEPEKIDALQQQANDRGFVLTEAICKYLLRHSRRDLPSLMMILDALDRYSLTHQRQITIPLLKKLLQGMPS